MPSRWLWAGKELSVKPIQWRWCQRSDSQPLAHVQYYPAKVWHQTKGLFNVTIQEIISEKQKKFFINFSKINFPELMRAQNDRLKTRKAKLYLDHKGICFPQALSFSHSQVAVGWITCRASAELQYLGLAPHWMNLGWGPSQVRTSSLPCFLHVGAEAAAHS